MPPLVEQSLGKIIENAKKRKSVLETSVERLAKEASNSEKRQQLQAVLRGIDSLDSKTKWAQNVLDYALRTRKERNISDLESEDLGEDGGDLVTKDLSPKDTKTTSNEERARRRELVIKGVSVFLQARRHYPMVRFLLSHEGKKVTTKKLVEATYGRATKNTIRQAQAAMVYLRKDIKNAGVPASIETEKKGYRLVLGKYTGNVVDTKETQRDRKELLPLMEVSKKFQIKDGRIRNYIAKGVLTKGKDYLEKKSSKAKIFLFFTPEGVSNVRRAEKIKEDEGTRLSSKSIKRLLEGKPVKKDKRLYGFQQVRMNPEKTAKLADLLTLGSEVALKYGIQVSPEDKDFYRGMWDYFCQSVADNLKFNARYFRKEVLPRLKRDLLAFSRNPEKAYEHFQQEKDQSKLGSDENAQRSYRRVISDTQRILMAIAAEKREEFINELFESKGPLLKQNHLGEPIQRAL